VGFFSVTRALSIAHVVWSGEVGGIERVVHDLALEQVRQGQQVSVVFGQAKGPFAAAIANTGARIADLRLRAGYDLRPKRIAWGASTARNADIVHLHGFNVSIAALALMARRPIVFTEHGTFGLGRRLGLKDAMKCTMKRSFLRYRVHELVANSAHTADRLSALYGVDRSRVTVIHNGFKGDRVFEPLERTRDCLTVAFVGRLVPFKRVDLLLRAVAKLPRTADVEVVVVGDGPLKRELAALAEKLRLGDVVRFTGFRSDIGSVLSVADVLVQPSADEPFGLAVLEAAAYGALPVVFADSGGALEVLPDDGLIVDDVDCLAETLEALKTSAALGNVARRYRADWARANFSIDQVAQKYLRVYQRACR
jgi:glycosyltransferase involved in cell wall biosynthesis